MMASRPSAADAAATITGGNKPLAGSHALAGPAALTADLGIAERRPLLLVSEDPVLLGVDIDEGQDVAAGQQRRAARQLRQELPVHLLQLPDIPPGERAQE